MTYTHKFQKLMLRYEPGIFTSQFSQKPTYEVPTTGKWTENQGDMEEKVINALPHVMEDYNHRNIKNCIYSIIIYYDQ